MTDTYQNLFSDWASVQHEFSMKEPEPEEVYLATYEYKDYSGSAEVYYRRGDKYYIATGSHCSCYGLEGNWHPEEYATRELFVECLKKGAAGALANEDDRVYAEVLRRLGEWAKG